MIRALMFDLDGTLIRSEELKALSYATAIQNLRGLSEPDPRAIDAYRDIVGVSRDVASRHIMDTLGLEPDLRPLVGRYGVSEPWDVLSEMRKEIYDEMVADAKVIRDNQWPHTVGMLRVVRDACCRTGLATMSYRDEALHVLRALDIERSLDVILTREDVQHPKPDPEVYLLGAKKLDVAPQECLVVEDSPNGVRAGVAAGMSVIAFATPFTLDALHSSEVLKHALIVHDPDTLLDVVQKRIAEHKRKAH